MNYPNGKKASLRGNANSPSPAFANRGMSLEDDINETNEFYLSTRKAVIHKKPTPVQIVKVDYPKRSAAVIKEAYFKQASTTDYNGVYRSKYIDFEAKQTKNKTSFPLSNVHQHQIDHMKEVIEHGGISFLIVRFSVYNKTFLFPGVKLFQFWESQYNGGKKSISYEEIKQAGIIIPFKYQARVDYLQAVDQLYF
ncbi:Holliday junction resolvase RecU [Sediminibacillus massiliensis]|uniref:Holliday junction resolvase RecU n=1 Tax=Sediminibacillus massiliensis TaxID=1926277 RepID=UPI0009883FF8|nr:Holliday junction resolvase RecU [Sediminibacillus massiliensis]